MERFKDMILFYFKEYSKFNKILSEKTEFANENKHFQKLINKKDLSISFILFSHIKQYFAGNSIDELFNLNENTNFLSDSNKSKINDDKYDLLYYWEQYLMISFVDELINLLKKRNKSSSGLNKILSLFHQNVNMLSIFYKNGKIDIEQILSLMDIFILWIKEGYNLINIENIRYDLFYKLKNYYIFQTYFDLAKNIFLIEVKSNDKNNNLKFLFEHLKKLNTINYEKQINNIILINNPSFHDFLSAIISNMNKELHKKYSKELINFCKDIILNNFDKSKIFEKMMDNMKNSFLDLSIIKSDENKEFENNIIKQNFYCELIKELFDANSEKYSFFNYNGIDSLMSYKISKPNLSNTIIVFSFKFYEKNNMNNEIIYPLITFYNESTNKNAFSLYIKFINTKKKFYLFCHEGKNKFILFEKDINLEKDKIYYNALYFENEKITIFLNDQKKIKEYNSKKEFNIIQIGYDQKHKDYFHGVIGPFFILERLKNENITNIIENILKLKDKYPDFIFSIVKDTLYDFTFINTFKYLSNYVKAQKEEAILVLLKDLKYNINCQFYVSPSILDYSTYIKEQNMNKNILPSIPYVCDKEKCYNISQLNVSLLISDKIQEKFLLNNGLYYICLQFEYFFQLFSIFLDKNINIKLGKDIYDIINNILHNSLAIINEYSYNILNFYKEFKMIFLNLLNCMKKFCLLTGESFSDSFIYNFGSLISGIFNDIEGKRQINYSNDATENDIKKLIIFRDGLIDFLFTCEFYKNSNTKMIQYIFTLLISISKNISDKIFLTNPNLLWKFLGFIQLLENDFSEKLILNNNNSNAFSNEIKNQMFSIIKEYFICIKSEKYHQDMLCKFFYYCLNNYKNKYKIMLYFMNLIYELISDEYYIEKHEIEKLISYAEEIINNNNDNNINNIENKINVYEEEENKEIKNKILCTISLILINLINFIYQDKKLKNDFINLLNSIDFTVEIIKSLNNELYKIFIHFFDLNNSVNQKSEIDLNSDKKNQYNILKIFSGIYKIIFVVFKIINDNINKRGIQKANLNNEILSLILLINKKINEEFKKDEKNDNIYFIFQNYIKFTYKIVFSKFFDNFTVIELDMFKFILSEIIDRCIKEYIFNTNILTKIKSNNNYYQKTFVEIIIDIHMKILFNLKFFKSSDTIYDNLNKIIFNPTITKKGETIFYFNDVTYLSKKPGKIEKVIININEIFVKKKKEKFENSFTIFALFKFASYYAEFKNKIFQINDDINNFLERILEKLLKEHFELYKSYPTIFSKTSKNLLYENLKDEIINYIISKKSRIDNLNIFSDFKDYFINNLSEFNSVSEEITSDNSNIEIIVNEIKKKFSNSSFIGNSMDINNKERREINHSLIITNSINSEEINSINENNINNNNEIKEFNGFYLIEKDEENKIKDNQNKKVIEDLIINEYINENKEINLTKLTENTYFLEDIDDYYINNIKKDIMNNIFSLYFIDTFFSNSLFKKMKILYFNEYPTVNTDTKKLNFPSKIKKFNNGVEPDNILKLNYKFFSDKYFPISHPYFYEYMIKNGISPSKYIKLYHKDINSTLNKKTIQLDCELIKADKYYFGEIYYIFQIEKNRNYIIFQEKKNKFSEYNENILDGIENGKNIFSFSFILHKMKNKKAKNIHKNQFKRNKKIVIIKLDEIDEIIEKRSFLMWQSIEIYLKNGKSYFFNLLSEENKNILIKEFEKEKNLKNLIHKKDFFYKNKPLTKSWKNKFVSTYENLLLLNKYASRTFNDISQYPVFPWILLDNYSRIGEINEINNYQEDNELYQSCKRKFKYPICLQEESKRESQIDKYLEDEEFPHHLGIHYSTSSFIDYYLMRQQPYSNLMIRLQNFQQENPNRMFLCLATTNNTIQATKDSREIIPELFSHFEYLINLNCDYLGIKFDDEIVDDHKILMKNTYFNVNKKDNPFFDFVYFIIEHKKLLNSKIVSKTINEWIDNIFGIGQYPTSSKVRENCCNIFIESSYEQLMNLREKYSEHIEEVKINNNKINEYKTFLIEINLVINFGVVPYQIFKEKYYKLGQKKKKVQNKINEIEEEEVMDKDEFEENAKNIHNMNKIYKMKEKNYSYNYFEINSSINKIFVISEEKFMEVIDINPYSKTINKNDGLIIELSPLILKELPNFSFQEKIDVEFRHSFYLYNEKYAFSSFDIEPEIIEQNPNNIFKTYGRTLVEEISLIKENKEKNGNNKYIKFITCRYADKSFKIHQLPMEKNKKTVIPRPISYICEDFVSSCCTISYFQFLIGLRNGKLIQFSLDNNLKIKIDRYIQCHNERINSIEINKKLGLIITSGNDNFVIIRKLYDFELLSPIKIKKKYVITLAKVSPTNFLYILCYDKQKKSCVIFGYTLNGLKFAKSEYGYYNNFDFTEDGNIVALKQMEKLCIFSGSNLDHIKIYNNSRDFEVINKIKNPIWLKYNYFLKKEKNEEYVHNRIITYVNDKKNLITIDVSDNCFFN